MRADFLRDGRVGRNGEWFRTAVELRRGGVYVEILAYLCFGLLDPLISGTSLFESTLSSWCSFESETLLSLQMIGVI